MQTVLYSHARNNLKEIINKVCDDFDECLITTKEKKTAILISYDEYMSMKETLYLMASKKNRERLSASIEEIENSSFIKKELNI